MRKLCLAIVFLNVGLWAETGHAGCYVVRDFFAGRCPTWEELDGSSSSNRGTPQCVCTNSFPPKCMSPELLERCAPSVGNCEYIADCVISGGGTSGGGVGCTTLACTACNGNDGEWHSNGTGYEVRRSGGTCSGNSCTSNGTCSGETVEYRCAPGYCGETTDGQTGCASVESLMHMGGSPSDNKAVLCRLRGSGTCPSDATECIPIKTTPPTYLATYNSFPGYPDTFLGGICTGLREGSTVMYQTDLTLEADKMCTMQQSSVCKSGDYGIPGSSGCTSCPSPGTSGIGTTSIGNCYIPTNKSYTDETGTYEYTSPCYYTN